MASMTELITPKEQTETHPAVERSGAFAVAARREHLTTDIRQLYKRNILDSMGCAIAAVAGSALRTLRDQIEEYRAPGRCTLIGGGKTSPDQAALFNSSLVRYVDLLDSTSHIRRSDLNIRPVCCWTQTYWPLALSLEFRQEKSWRSAERKASSPSARRPRPMRLPLFKKP